MSLGGSARVSANHGESEAEITGAAQCAGEDFSCDEGQYVHASVEGAHEFAASDQRDIDGDLISGEMSYVETYAPDGALASVTVSADLLAANTSKLGGGGSSADADYTLYLEAPGSISLNGTFVGNVDATDESFARVGVDLRVSCDNAEYEVEFDENAGGDDPGSSFTRPVSKVLADDPVDCDISLYVDASATSTSNEAGHTAAADVEFQLVIATDAGAGPCTGVHGAVANGGQPDGHIDPLRGIRVELRRDNARVGEPVATDAAGAFCIPTASGVIEPGEYQLRATLIDATHEPPIFQTEHGIDAEATWTEVSITADDFGPDATTDLAFSSTPERPWLANVASIHWQSERMVRWILEELGVTPQVLGTFSIETYSTDGTSYSPSQSRIRINSDGTAQDDSTFADRATAHSEGPENLEWHEIGHHLAKVLGIAPTSTAPACVGRASHGGWSNATTCDSVSEGFASFIATLASLDIDAGLGEGWGDDVYSLFSGLERNVMRPWSAVADASGRVYYFEDRAVSNLLWDLFDATPDETQAIVVADPDPEATIPIDARDRVALGGVNLVQILAEIRPETVDAIYQGLMSSPLVPADVKTPATDLDGDGAPDVGALQEVFLMHGFHVTRPGEEPLHVVGTPIGRTDRELAPSGELVPRPHMEQVAGANVLLQNPSSAPVTVGYEVTGMFWKEGRSVTVPAVSQLLLYVHPIPYWTGPLPASGLPACGKPDPVPTSILITAAGMPDFEVTGCEWLHAIAAADGDVAMTYAVAAGTMPQPGASGAPSGAPSGPTQPTDAPAGSSGILLAVAVGAIILGIAIAFGIRRRRGSAPG
jgi:hypothetical protein